jgi:hypothetical protein
MKIVLEVWQVISLLIAGAGVLVGLVKWGTSQIKASIDLRMNGFERLADGWREQERAVLQLRIEMAERYVRREDYVRGQTVIEAKLDAINSEMKMIQLQGGKA